MKKIIFGLIIALFLNLTLFALAKRPLMNGYQDIINKNPISKTATVAVSIKDAKSGRTVFETNENKLLHPASTQKVFTTMAAVDTLGKNYEFKTAFYKDKSGNLYIKLGADPFLSSLDLKAMVKGLQAKQYKAVYIDDSIIDDVSWGESWMSDDNTNSLMPKFSPYNLDRNTLKLTVTPSENGKPAVLKYESGTISSVINLVTTSTKDNIKVKRYNWQSPDVVYVEGNVSKPTMLQIPINNPRRYFIWRLSELFASSKIKFHGEITTRTVPKDAILLTETKRAITPAVASILQNSDNLAAESLFKVAGGKFGNTKGTSIFSEAMFLEYYNRLNLNPTDIVIADASGISRNNLSTADWMTKSLVKFYDMNEFEFLKSNLSNPSNGTMFARLKDLTGNIWAKTGTLSNVSAICGYVQAKNGKVYAFTILLQNFKEEQKAAKALEDDIIRRIAATDSIL